MACLESVHILCFFPEKQIMLSSVSILILPLDGPSQLMLPSDKCVSVQQEVLLILSYQTYEDEGKSTCNSS
jgi:hypothetical protein